MKRTLTSTLRSLRTRKHHRRPRISPPSNFRHVYSHSHQFSADAFEYVAPVHRPPPSLLPHLDKEVSPILPYFGDEEVATPPPVAWLKEERNSLDSKGSGEFKLRKSCSTLSFHVPRRLVGTPPSLHSSPGSQNLKAESLGLRLDSPPPPPEVPPRSRARAYTAPETVDELRERVAGAMIEKERLQGMIDEIVERHSVYLGSSPGTPRSAAGLSAGESCSPLSFC